ncbi:septum formation inhibitor Maf [Corynebacterium sp. zg254]|uniref:Nucleoside triphosphate pyrophosphatase n=1 Tax=Corynebacterium zhongnanshanii TaxID=2768834 RepID=A0ABQ6VET6_9CORY|nr:MULTISPECIES: nucleoside triphosphate pyrophosphatase [Corynebacterium]KAB3522947.1 septum formation inhibitor Maf [Corynebacterium zhongnanshanii]MCR5913974.1 septum formation inhibitor Maf [Corynebacterium sp. zg254]
MAGTSPRLVLASTSASRLSILRSAGVEPEVAPSGVDEDAVVAALHNPSPDDVVRALATAKARSVAQDYLPDNTSEQLPEGLVVVGADSMLLIDGELQGKPHTEEETIRRWRNQRGRTAELITGHAMMADSLVFTEVSRTRIQFAQATDEDIAAYAATGEPFGCAGAFTLEALGGWFIDRIEGDPSSVIGLSLPVLRRGLTVFGFHVSQFWNR